MQVATNGLREHEQPMSWARALILATGFFFLAIILIGQIPGYFYTVSTLATLARFEQGTLDLGLLAVGMGVLCLEISLLYDPKPLLPPEVFDVIGLAIAAFGCVLLYQVWSHNWNESLPSTGTLLAPIWFQAGSIDLISVGMIALVIGLGMFVIGALCRPTLAGRMTGPGAALIVRGGIVVGIALLAVWVTIFTFSPRTLVGVYKAPNVDGFISVTGNVMLFVALCLFLLSLLVWLLPIMIAHRQQFMPGIYLNGVVGLVGTIGAPLLVLWAAIYPIVYLIRQIDATQFIVQCNQKTVIPGSCTFTPYTGYIVVALVVGVTFQVFALAFYFWSTRRNTVLLGATIGLIYVGLAGSVIHVDEGLQLPIGLFLAAGIALLAFVFAWSSQREFANTRAEALGCTGQWLLVGTGVFIYLAGFSVLSFPNFFESEALGLYYIPGNHTLHDAFWGLLLMGGLALMQYTLLVRRQPMSNLRKFVMWTLLVAIALELVGAIQGFHSDILKGGWDVAEGSHAVFFAGACVEVAGLVVAVFGAAIRASSIRWFLVVLLPVLIGAAVASVAYQWPGNWAELVVMGFILCTVGAFAYAVAGPDWVMVLVPADIGTEGTVSSSV